MGDDWQEGETRPMNLARTPLEETGDPMSYENQYRILLDAVQRAIHAPPDATGVMEATDTLVDFESRTKEMAADVIRNHRTLLKILEEMDYDNMGPSMMRLGLHMETCRMELDGLDAAAHY